MTPEATVVAIGTLDTKGREYGFLRERLRAAGVRVALIDCGVLGEPGTEPDVSAADVAAAAGRSLADLRFTREGSDTRAVALEAMARGVPLACSNATSLPEVTGDAAELLDPLDVAAMSAAIRRVLDEPRPDLVERGRERARQFDWRLTGQRTLELLTEVATMPRRVTGPVLRSRVEAGR